MEGRHVQPEGRADHSSAGRVDEVADGRGQRDREAAEVPRHREGQPQVDVEVEKSDITSLAGTISSGAGLSNLFGTDANGNPTVANVGTFLSSQVGPLQKFASDLKWAQKNGLAPGLLSQIANLGPTQGDEILQQFMSGQASIAQANQAEGAINTFSKQGATTTEDAVYASKITKQTLKVDENTNALKDLTKHLHDIERSTAKRAAMQLTIDAKTGKPEVDKKFIDDIIKGIKQANREAGLNLLAA